ncbi:MAG: stage II sporulation protein M, partial [Candidatus Hydrothermarchaeales archaeon]
MKNLRYAASLFLLGWIVGTLLGVTGYSTPAFLSWRFSLLDLNKETYKIILNNGVAAFTTAFGAIIAAKLLKIEKSDSEGVAFLFMIPTLILFLNGFSAGYFTGALVGKLTLSLILLSIAPHGVLEIPAIILSGAVGFTNIEGLGNKGIPGKKYVPLILLFIVVGGYVEGNVTSELPQLKSPIKIVDVDIPSSVDAGIKFPVIITVENSGIIKPKHFVTLYGSGSERIYEEASFPLGESTMELEMAVYTLGEQDITAAIVDETGVIESRNLVLDVKEPQISIEDVSVPMLYAGEEAVLEITIVNGDEVNRTMDLVFESSTGALSGHPITLAPGEKLVHQFHTLIGQPGPRIFNIYLHWHGLILSQKNVDTEVLGLRIKPAIVSVNVPELQVNRSSIISVEIENTGQKDGTVSLLAFDSNMPQLFKQGSTLGVIMNRGHLGTGLIAEKELFLESGET